MNSRGPVGLRGNLESQASIGVPSAQASVPHEAQDGLVGGTSLWATMWGWAGTARSTMLFFAAGIGGFVACCGVALLVCLFVARNYAPASAHIVKPLFFDYTQLQASASASLIDDRDVTSYKHFREKHRSRNAVRQPQLRERFLPPGEQISVWVDLQMPPTTAVVGDLFQAVGELQAADGSLAARASRPMLPSSQTPILAFRRLWTLPLRTMGLWRDDVKLRVNLFERYTEQVQQPFALFTCTLHGRAGGGLPPPAAQAEVHVHLHLGPLRRALYWVRPGGLLTLWLAGVGLISVMGGACASFVLLVLWLWSISGGGGAGGAAAGASPLRPAEEDALSSGDGSSGALASGEVSESDDEGSKAWAESGGGEAGTHKDAHSTAMRRGRGGIASAGRTPLLEQAQSKPPEAAFGKPAHGRASASFFRLTNLMRRQ